MGYNGLFSDDSDFNQIRGHVTWVATDCSQMILILIRLEDMLHGFQRIVLG